jgi:hypothetical protein
MPYSQRSRLRLLQPWLTYHDERFAGFDAVVLMEVIVTTPSAEHNVRNADLPAGTMRHRNHRFAWTRDEFADWATRVGNHHGYSVQFRPIGEEVPHVGPPTQMGAFTGIDNRERCVQVLI